MTSFELIAAAVKSQRVAQEIIDILEKNNFTIVEKQIADK